MKQTSVERNGRSQLIPGVRRTISLERMVKVSGTWVGEYHYDPSSPGRSTPFTLQLAQGWFGRVSGIVQDGLGGMPEEGRVIGLLRGKTLQFRKLMPIARVAAAEGTQTLAESLASVGSEFRVAEDTAHPPILYSGLLSADGRSVAGTWSVKARVVPLIGRNDGIQLGDYSGSWSASRVDGAAEQGDEADEA